MFARKPQPHIRDVSSDAQPGDVHFFYDQEAKKWAGMILPDERLHFDDDHTTINLPLVVTQRYENALDAFSDVITGGLLNRRYAIELRLQDVGLRKLLAIDDNNEHQLNSHWRSITIVLRHTGHPLHWRVTYTCDNGTPVRTPTFVFPNRLYVLHPHRLRPLPQSEYIAHIVTKMQVFMIPRIHLLLPGTLRRETDDTLYMWAPDGSRVAISRAKNWEVASIDAGSPCDALSCSEDEEQYDKDYVQFWGPLSNLREQRQNIEAAIAGARPFESEPDCVLKPLGGTGLFVHTQPLPRVIYTWWFLHGQLIEFCLCFSELPQYVVLWILDWLPGMELLRHLTKLRTIESVLHSIGAVLEKRSTRRKSVRLIAARAAQK